MTDDLDTLRPEVRESVEYMDRGGVARIAAGGWRIIRAELLRLAEDAAMFAHAVSLGQRYKQRAEKAEAELAALKARTQWQAIETAPRDGTWIYVCRAGQPHSGTKVKFSRDCGGCPESWWDGSGFYRNSTFTHWMPLPPPPKVEE